MLQLKKCQRKGNCRHSRYCISPQRMRIPSFADHQKRVTQTTESVLASQSPLQTTVRMGEGGKWLSPMERTVLTEYSICQHGDWEKAKLVDECIR